MRCSNWNLLHNYQVCPDFILQFVGNKPRAWTFKPTTTYADTWPVDERRHIEGHNRHRFYPCMNPNSYFAWRRSFFVQCSGLHTVNEQSKSLARHSETEERLRARPEHCTQIHTWDMFAVFFGVGLICESIASGKMPLILKRICVAP